MSRRFFEVILAIKCKCQGNEERICDELGLSQAEFNGLIVLDGGQEIPGGEFAERMGLSPSRGSRVLNTLVVHGYVRTHPGPGDRRVTLVELTPKGRRVRQSIITRIEACESRIRERLDDEGMRQVRQALELLETAL